MHGSGPPAALFEPRFLIARRDLSTTPHAHAHPNFGQLQQHNNESKSTRLNHFQNTKRKQTTRDEIIALLVGTPSNRKRACRPMMFQTRFVAFVTSDKDTPRMTWEEIHDTMGYTCLPQTTKGQFN